MFQSSQTAIYLQPIASKDLSFTEKDLLGHGSYGDVYLGQWQSITVAIKKLDLKKLTNDLSQDFQNEATIMAQCQFPHIVRLYGVCMEVGNYAMVMEYMPKGSLYQVLHDRDEPLPWNPLRWDIAIDIGRGLHYLHSKNILHRDLKSQNVLLDRGYQAKIGDFGLAKLKLESSSTSTKSKNIMGTTRWRAPELFRRGMTPNKTTDIYSYGMVMWEIVTRQLPFNDASDETTAGIWIGQGEKENIPADCPSDYAALIQTCWEAPEKRPEAETVLQTLLKYKPVISKPAEPSQTEPKKYVEKSWHFDPMTKRKAALAANEQLKKKYLLLDATPKDTQKVIDFYAHHPVAGYDVGRVQVIYNKTFNVQFEAQLDKLQQRKENLAFAPTWATMSHPDFRQIVYRQFEERTTHKDPDYPDVKLMPAFHGTSRSILDSIFRAGYANLGTVDEGFFGKGYYSAWEAEYAYKYSNKEAFLLFNWVASFSALPVIEGDMPLLQGKGPYKNYDAHFAPVGNASNPDGPSYNPLKYEDWLDYHQYTEIVVFESAACLPRYLVELQPTMMKPMPSITQDQSQQPVSLTLSQSFSNLLPLATAAAFENDAFKTVLGSYIKDFTEPLTYEEVRVLNLQIKEEEVLKDWLFSFVEASKKDKSLGEKAAKAISTLNDLQVSFTDKYRDLSFVSIPGANLYGGVFSGASFKGADLQGVNFAGACLMYVDFSKADLSGATFGEYPLIELKDEVQAVCLSKDGQSMAIASGHDIEIYQKNAEGYDYVRTLQGHTSSVTSVAYSGDNQSIVSGSWDHTVRLWEAKTGKPLATLQGHTEWVKSIAYSYDNQTIVSGSADNTVRLWEAKTGKPLATLLGHTDGVSSVAYSFDNQTIVSGSDDNTVRLWEAKTGKPLATLQGHTDWVNSVAYSFDNQTIVSGSDDNTVRLWEAKTGKPPATLLGHTGSVHCAAYSPDNQSIVSGFEDKTVRLWNAKTGKLLATLEEHTGAVSSVAYSPDNQTIASGSADNTVCLWNAKTGKLLATLEEHTDAVSSVAYSPDNQTIVSGSDDNTVCLWNAKTGEPLATLKRHMNLVTSVAYSPDNQTIVSGSLDNTVCLWNAKTGKLLATLPVYTSVTSVAYSFDNQTIVSGSWDKTVQLWDAKTGQPLATLKGHTSGVTSVAYSPDNQSIVVGSRTAIIVWKKLKKNEAEVWMIEKRLGPSGRHLILKESKLRETKLSEINRKLFRQRGAKESEVKISEVKGTFFDVNVPPTSPSFSSPSQQSEQTDKKFK